jgi:hypothetical protein
MIPDGQNDSMTREKTDKFTGFSIIDNKFLPPLFLVPDLLAGRMPGSQNQFKKTLAEMERKIIWRKMANKLNSV